MSLRLLTLAWLALVAITLLSFVTAEFVGARHLAVAAIMLISASKVGIILARFMEVRHATPGVRAYMIGWPLVCGAMITALYWAAA